MVDASARPAAMDAQARSALSSPLLLRLLIFPDAVSLLQRRPLSSSTPPAPMVGPLPFSGSRPLLQTDASARPAARASEVPCARRPFLRSSLLPLSLATGAPWAQPTPCTAAPLLHFFPLLSVASSHGAGLCSLCGMLCSPVSSCAHGTSPCLLSVPSDQQQGQPPSLAPFRCARGVRHNACEEDILSQHHRRSPGICCFCATPNIDVVHPGETVTLLVRFRIGVIFILLIVNVCCFVFVLWRRGTPCFARRRQAAQCSSDVRSDAQIGITIVLTNTD
jgi:hypothetical protein